MGEFYWNIGVWSADQERMETVSALVDTGASYSVFSRPMLERLGIRRLERVGFEQADGSIIELDVGVAWLTINGRDRVCSVAFGPDDAEPIIGANALQEFLLLIDPVAERLISRTGRIKTLVNEQQTGNLFHRSIRRGRLPHPDGFLRPRGRSIGG